MSDSDEPPPPPKIIVAGVETSELEYGALLKFGATLFETLQYERTEKNSAQIMHDKMLSACKITLKELEDTKTELLDAARDVEKESVRQEKYIQEVHDKGLNNLYETELKLKQIEKDMEEFAEAFNEKWHEEIEVPFWQKKMKYKKYLRNLNKEQLEFIEEMNKNFADEMEEIENKMNSNENEFIKRSKARWNKMLELNELELRTENLRMEERYNWLLEELESRHCQTLEHMREFFNGTMENDVALIGSLTKEYEKLKDRIPWIEAQCALLVEECKSILNPIDILSKIQKQRTIQWKFQMADQAKTVTYKNTINRLKKKISDETVRRAGALTQCENLERKNDQIQLYLDNMEQRVREQSQEFFEQIANRLTILMEQEVESRAKVLEVVETVPDGQQLLKNWRSLFAHVDKVTEQLKYSIAKNMKAHDDIINVVTAKIFNMTNKQICKIPYICEKHNKNPANLVALSRF